MSELESVLATVRERVQPDAEERERLRAVAERLADRARDAIDDLPTDADVVQVGSTARGTWLSGDRDIDLFVRFPPELPREELESYGLDVGHAVLPDGHEEYAEHPYVKGSVEGFDIDLVPCYDVAEATEIQSAVDRTPFHTQYLEARLDADLAGDVLLAKRFLKAIGAYGSDLKTRGFSGYLTELLVVEHGGFVPLVEAAATWHPPVELDPEEHGTRTFDDPLVVIDPTDPERNVAAVLSAENVARFQHYARDLLADPREALFFPPEREPIGTDELREHLARRETEPIAVVFDAPDLVDDQLWPQLRKSLSGAVQGLEERGFRVLRSRAMVEEDVDSPREAGTDRLAVLLVELEVSELPAVERHEGPPVHVREHAEGFYAGYADDGEADGDATADRRTYGPFLEGNRYVVEREREVTDAAAFLASDDLLDVGLGAHVSNALEDRTILRNEDVGTLADGFGDALREYFDPQP
ncbi:MAG: CCA tRNA nucleotidyltransferase [Halopenitus sp.]